MTDARQLMVETRVQLQAVEQQLMAHPYLVAVEAGHVAREQLQRFAGEQYTIIASDLRSFALLLHRFAHLPSRDYLLGLLQGEAAAQEALLAFAQALAMREDDLKVYEPLPGCQAYPAYVAWLALYGSPAAVAAALLANLPAWGTACARLSAAFQAQYHLPPAAVRFFDLFATPAPEFEADSLRIMQDDLDRGADPRAVMRAARLIQAYEGMFWDALDAASR